MAWAHDNARSVHPLQYYVSSILNKNKKACIYNLMLHGLKAAQGEWTLVCIAFNLKRLHTLKEVKKAAEVAASKLPKLIIEYCSIRP